MTELTKEEYEEGRNAAVKQVVETIQEAAKTERKTVRSRELFEWRGILAFLALVGVFALGTTRLLLYGDAEIPGWAAGIAAAIITYYFNARSNGKTNEH